MEGLKLAIYSLHHSNVGKGTQAQVGTAGAHVHYITRAGAARLVMSEHMPTDRHQARSWMDEREVSDRKNGRVIDKVMVALPVELDASQRADLVREFAQAVGGGRIAWMASVHDRGEDAHNPHAHVILRDKDHETGKRVFGTSEKGSTDRLREIWEDVANQSLERAGIDTRIDRRSLAEQGVDREAGLHIGPNVLAMEERGLRPVSLPQEVENGRVINWPEIDQGRTRADRQREIEAGNLDLKQERGKDKEKDKGRAHVMLTPDLAEQRTLAWAECEADKRAEAQRQTEELLALARQAVRPQTQQQSAPVEKPSQDPEPENRHSAGGIPAANIEATRWQRIKDQANQVMARAAAKWKIETPRLKPELAQQPRQVEPEATVTAWPQPVWQRVDCLARIPQLQAPEATRGPPGQAGAQEPKLGVARVAGYVPEAIQRPSYEVEVSTNQASQAEKARLSRLIEAGRSRLSDLAERLERAFERVQHRQAERPAPAGDWADKLLAGARREHERQPKQPEHERPGRTLWQSLERRPKPGEPGF